MTYPRKTAKCHPDRPNYSRSLCEECFTNRREGRCLHDDRPKDKHGRCSSCMASFYHHRRSRGLGDAFGTPRKSRKLSHISDPVLRNTLVRRKRRARSYGLTLEQYNFLLEKQNGLCAICGEPPTPGKDLCVDHDHSCCPDRNRSCGKCVRGLLCHGCNMRLGQLESSLVQRSLEYLANYKHFVR